MLKRLPLRDGTLALALLGAAMLYGAKSTIDAAIAGPVMVDKAPIACSSSSGACLKTGAAQTLSATPEQVG